MAIINKTGISNGSTIQAEHVTRTIDALSGVSTATIVATGSFTGSLVGNVIGTVTGSINITNNSTLDSRITATQNAGLNLQEASTGIGFVIPIIEPTAPTIGSMYIDVTGPILWIYDGANWRGWENDF
jgi:hypothetical protein